MTGIAQVQKLITSVLGSRFQRELKQLRPIVAAIHRHEEALKGLSDEALQQQTAAFRARIAELVIRGKRPKGVKVMADIDAINLM